MEQRDEIGARNKAYKSGMMELMYAEIRRSLVMPLDAYGIVLSLTGIFQDLTEARNETGYQDHLRSTTSKG